MSKKYEFHKVAAKVAKRLYRRAPQKFRHSIKSLITESFPAVAGHSNVMSHAPKRPGATTLHMTSEDIGATYDENEILPMLALENEALHHLLRQSRQELLNISRSQSNNENPSTSLSPNGRKENAAALAEDFLAGQPDGPIRHLVLANEYPRAGKEYGNGFVHQRVKQYLEAGVAVDVVCAGYSVDQDLYHYDGVRVLTGHGEEISEVLKRQAYTSVSIHFLNNRIWNAIEPFLADLDVHVFLHGYECSRWIRRVWNYKHGQDLERAIERSINLQNFWHEVIHHPHQPRSYIFVSNWWRQAVLDDMRLTFPSNRVRVIHNYINSDLFDYRPKDIEQRFKLLWIRSASNRNYANDIAIRVLEHLSKTEYWDRCTVTIIGDGQYFPEFEQRLGKFKNVEIQQRYASQQEISALHKDHGIFLVPTRLDSQGVSRDEAMSSGLVPATNLVAAVPEFIDQDSGILAGPEDAKKLAEGIVDLWKNPEKFQALSKAAAMRVRQQSGYESTVEREMQILGLKAGSIHG